MKTDGKNCGSKNKRKNYGQDELTECIKESGETLGMKIIRLK